MNLHEWTIRDLPFLTQISSIPKLSPSGLPSPIPYKPREQEQEAQDTKDDTCDRTRCKAVPAGQGSIAWLTAGDGIGVGFEVDIVWISG